MSPLRVAVTLVVLGSSAAFRTKTDLMHNKAEVDEQDPVQEVIHVSQGVKDDTLSPADDEGEGAAGSPADDSADAASLSATNETDEAPAPACLCIFDVDRTLTAGQQHKCPGTKTFPGVPDPAYSKGNLQLSAGLMKLKATACGKCYFGIVSKGDAGGKSGKMRGKIDSMVEKKLNVGGWVDGCPSGKITGTKVLSCQEEKKKHAMAGVVQYIRSKGIQLKDADVWFYDDIAGNVQDVKKTGYNGKQVSCVGREVGGVKKQEVGKCGATAAEFKREKGLKLCPQGSRKTSHR